jgi:PAS domain S-box-containing protein
VWWLSPGLAVDWGAPYLAVHTLLETFAVVVSAIIFGVGWNAGTGRRTANVVVLACAFLAVALLDVAHFLSYAGMPELVTPAGPEKAIDFWLAARLAAVLGMLVVTLRSWQTPIAAPAAYGWLAGALAYVALVVWLVLVHPDWLPRTFVPGSGLTGFKIVAEWLVVLVAAVVAVLVWRQRRQPMPAYDAASLFGAAAVTILSELCFTLYASVSDTFNLLGHLYKVVAYVFIYRAVFVVAVRAPYVELRASEERYRRILESAPDAIVGIDAGQRIVSFNASAEALYGYRAPEVMGRPVAQLMAEPLPPSAPGAKQLVVGRRKDGAELLLEVGRVDLEMQGEKLVIAMARDMTEQRRAEAEIRRLNAELEDRVRQRTAQLESVNQELEAFSYSVSHDLRAPLRAIDGFAQALREDSGDRLDAEGQDYIDRIRAGAQRMGSLIDDLLQLARVGRIALHPGTVDLSAMAHEIATSLRAAYPGREVAIDILPGLVARGDPTLLRMLLTNLLDNAWKYTGRVAAARVGLEAARHDGEQVYCVRDNGAGFDMQYAGRLFRPFQRLHRSAEFAGTGVGLAIVERIVVRHGGRVWAEAEPGKGARFYFTLPGIAGAEPAPGSY